jgi:hypothetical protein
MTGLLGVGIVSRDHSSIRAAIARGRVNSYNKISQCFVSISSVRLLYTSVYDSYCPLCTVSYATVWFVSTASMASESTGDPNTLITYVPLY